MRPIAFVPLLLLAAVSEMPAQNFVQNGDFSATTITPWTTTGYALNPGLGTLDVDGTGSSQAYAASPGGQSAPPPYPPHKLQQTVVLVPAPFELTFDLAQTNNGPSLVNVLPVVNVYLGTQLLATHGFKPMVPVRSIRRERMAIQLQPTTAGPHVLSIELSFSSLASANTPRFWIDNVRLALARNPLVAIRGERMLGTSVSFEVLGSANAGYLVLLSPSLLPAPVTIPGLSGQLALHPAGLIVFLQGALNAQGGFRVSLPIPLLPSLAGVPLHWQGVQATASGAGFGWSSMQAFYL